MKSAETELVFIWPSIWNFNPYIYQKVYTKIVKIHVKFTINNSAFTPKLYHLIKVNLKMYF